MDAIKVSKVSQMRLLKRQGSDPPSTPTLGSLHLTPHHLIFRSVGATELWIPLPLLHSVARTAPNLTGTVHPLLLRTRDFKAYELSFSAAEEADGVWESLKGLCGGVGAGGLETLYAFFYEGELGQAVDRKGKGKAGWGIYEPEKEFARMGVGSRSKAWRASEINADYEFCPSYPASIMVPAKISDTTLGYAVKYRSKGRIPGLVYLHWANLGSITRSSQPMVGLKNARSIQDEKLIEAIFSSHSQHSTAPPRHAFILSYSSSSSSSADGQVVYGAQATNLIIDARPTTNAMANSVKGAGTENMEHYRNCKKAYLGIDNIHVMRASLSGIYDALRDSESTGHLDRTALKRTQWLKHLTNILDGILVITRTIHLFNSHVLVHCSDGWDRTSQLSSLAQLCLDPYYRTAQGLAVLIEKDWVSYGHRFSDRTGHLCGDKTAFVAIPGDNVSAQAAFLASVQKQFAGSSHAFKETCPVFQQFLDCIYQIQRQFPERFEWSEKLLRKLQWETYAGRSGTFLFNSERQREGMRGRERTQSVWEGMFDLEGEELVLKEEYKNEAYDKSLDDPESRALDADQGVLLVNPHDVKWWFELFGRGEEEMNGRPAEVVVVDEVNEEPDVTIVQDALHDPFATLGTDTPPLPRSTTPLVSSAPSLPSQVQLAEAVSSVQKFGWGAWKGIQKGYQEAVTQYRDSSPVPPTSPPSSTRAADEERARHARVVDGEASNLGWRAEGDGAELWSKIVGAREKNDWAASEASTSRISTAPASPLKASTLPVRSRLGEDPLEANGKRRGSSSTAAVEVGLASVSIKADNPWERTPSRSSPGSSVLARSQLPTELLPRPVERMGKVEEKVEGVKGAAFDPLGVGFS